jgi:hypothetical protein
MDRPTSAKDGQGLIIIRLLGGLGNQMFQYALGRSLSAIYRRPLKFDLSFYNSDAAKSHWAPRFFCLDHFNIKLQIVAAAELAPFEKYLRQNIYSRLLRRAAAFGCYYLHSYIFEPPKNYFVFDPNLLAGQLKPNVYLDGFWQTEKYFSSIENIIRKDFIFKDLPDEINQKMLAEIDSVNSVSIHVRHGDNATKIAAKHGVLPLEYYYSAISDLVKTVKSPKFYVFSDDPVWVKENLKLDFPAVFVSNNSDKKNYEDLRLMTRCKHHIIGNSTFSWWGAWLGKKPGQQVYAPKRYHVHDNIPTTDLYPSQWKLINN